MRKTTKQGNVTNAAVLEKTAVGLTGQDLVNQVGMVEWLAASGC